MQCSPPFVGADDPELELLPDDVRADYERGMADRDQAGWPDDVPCFWLDLQTLRCRHYDHRPMICRDFDVGGEGCRVWRAEFNIDVEHITRAW